MAVASLRPARPCRTAAPADPEAREIYDIGLASQRVAAAAEASHCGDARLVLTGRVLAMPAPAGNLSL